MNMGLFEYLPSFWRNRQELSLCQEDTSETDTECEKTFEVEEVEDKLTLKKFDIKKMRQNSTIISIRKKKVRENGTFKGFIEENETCKTISCKRYI